MKEDSERDLAPARPELREPEEMDTLQGEIPSDVNEVHAIVDAYDQLLDKHRWPLDKEFISEGFREALVNAINHGNHNDPVKKVSYEARVSDRQIQVRVHDEGIGFNPEKLKDPTISENLMETSGRGIKSFMQTSYKVVFAKVDQGFQVTLIKTRPENT